MQRYELWGTSVLCNQSGGPCNNATVDEYETTEQMWPRWKRHEWGTGKKLALTVVVSLFCPKCGFVLGAGLFGGNDEGSALMAAAPGACSPRSGGCSAAGNTAAVQMPTKAAKLAHIFRNAPGHVNPTSMASRARFGNLFERVASNPSNLRSDAVTKGIITAQAARAGVDAYTWSGRTGQVWVTVRNGTIENAGVNPVGSFR